MKKAIIVCPTQDLASRAYNDILRELNDRNLIPAGSRFLADPYSRSFSFNGWSVRVIACRREGTLSHLSVDYSVPYHPEAERGDEFRDAPHTTADLMKRVTGRRWA